MHTVPVGQGTGSRPQGYRLLATLVVVLLLAPVSVTTAAAATDTTSPAPVDARADTGVTRRAPTASWSGRLAGTRAFVAVVATRDQIIVYVCDNGSTSEWFAGANSGRTVLLRSPGGAVVTVTLGRRATGTVQLQDGSIHGISLRRDRRPALFRAEAGSVREGVLAGWIRLASGATRGSLQTGLRTGGLSTLLPAPELGSVVTVEIPGIPLLDLTPKPLTPDTVDTPVPNDTQFRWAAMGDSFASGEGYPERGIADAEDHDDFTGLRWGNDPSIFHPFETASDLSRDLYTCHRSDQAGAPRADRELQTLYPTVDFAFTFTACGGATTEALTTDGYLGPDATEASWLDEDPVAQPSQIDRIGSFAGNAGLDAIFMSIGGNDAGFGPIVSSCLDPTKGPCDEALADALTANLAALEDRYDDVADRLALRFGDRLPPVLISHYPNPMDDGVTNPELTTPACFGDDYLRRGEVGFGAPDDFLQDNISAAEADFAFGIAARLNGAVAAAAEDHDWIEVDGHVDASRSHGLCANQPFFNLNSSALRRQGHDHPQAIFVISSGLLHPNNAGWDAYGDAIVSELRPLVDAELRGGLQPATNLRVARAFLRGNITIRWNDRSTAEDTYEVEVVPLDRQSVDAMIYPPGSTRLTNGGFRLVVSGANLQEYTHVADRPGTFRYRVRPCNTSISAGTNCGFASTSITGSNTAPTVPIGLTFERGSQPVTVGSVTATLQLVRLVWTADPKATEYVVRVTGQADTRTTQPSSPFLAIAVAASADWQVSACNPVGCSLFSRPLRP